MYLYKLLNNIKSATTFCKIYTRFGHHLISDKMNKIVKSKAKIRFQDCDPHNHLNNAQYIDYFMNAREDQLIEHFDFDIF